MPTPMLQENWGKLLEPGLRAVFFKEYDAISGGSKINFLYNVVGSTKAVEHTYGVGSFGNVPEYNGAISYDNFSGDYPADFTHKEFALGTQVERKLVEDDLYNIIYARSQNLGMSFSRTREIHAASTFVNAFTASGVTGYDGVTLCSASHPLGINNASVYQSNTGTNTFDATGIKTSRLLMRKWTDDRGNLLPIIPDTLLVPPDLEYDARVLLDTPSKVGSADNDVNYVRGLGLNLLVWDYLTDPKAWFLIDSRYAKMHNWWFNRTATEFVSSPDSDYTMIAKYRGYMRYSFGWDSWMFVYGNKFA
jgi:phage major head subunit gpT-like protein